MLYAAAMDDRIALVVPHESGSGGVPSSRFNPKESIKDVNQNFPYWFNDRFSEFSDNPDRLPFDQHAVVALVAPRYVLDSEGLYGTCGYYRETLPLLQKTNAVYELYGEKGILETGSGADIPEDYPGQVFQLVLGKFHFLDVDYWEKILAFADVKFHGKTPPATLWKVYEAEEASLHQCDIDAKYRGHSGVGYVSNFNHSGAFIEWKIDPGEGEKYIKIRASCGRDVLKMEIQVNGEVVKREHVFRHWSMGEWFADYSVKARFRPGQNTVRFTKLDSGELLIDCIEIAYQTACDS